jgi:hypothetical protein
MESQSTNRQVLAIRLDIIIKNNRDKICLLVDVAMPVDRNTVDKETLKKLKI